MRTPKIFILFLSVIIVVVGGLSYLSISAYNAVFHFPPALLHAIILAATIIPLILLATMIIGNKYYSEINSWIYTVSMVWVPKLLYLSMEAIVLSVLLAIGVPSQALMGIASIGLVAIALVLIYGIYQALHPKIKTYEITVPALRAQWANKKIVMFSDSHLGMVRHSYFMQKIADMINTISPDIVFIAGDLIDGPAFPYKKGLAPLGSIKSTYGTFYTAGNHDEYNQDQQEFMAALAPHATILNDALVTVNDTQIVGIMYAIETVAATEDKIRQTGFDKAIPSIGILHDPKNIRAFANAGVSLGLSGHTHGGQFFPFSLIVRAIYKDLIRGVHYIDAMAHLTSVGVGTAGPVLRFGARPEITLIKII